MKDRYVLEYGTRDYERGGVEVVGTWKCSAYDHEHALEKFHDTDPDAGWVVTRIARWAELPHRMTWFECGFRGLYETP